MVAVGSVWGSELLLLLNAPVLGHLGTAWPGTCWGDIQVGRDGSGDVQALGITSPNLCWGEHKNTSGCT